MPSGSRSVNVWRTCATHSHPAFVLSAYRYEADASSACLAICFAIVRATSLRMMSPTVMPLTPPSGFRSAVIRPRRKPSNTSEGDDAPGKQRTHLPKHLRITLVLQDGEAVIGCYSGRRPAAAPRLPVRKQSKNSTGSRTNGWSGSHSITSQLNGTLGNAGRRSGSVKALNVARSPGAFVAPSNACRADDNSPNWQRCTARDALTCSSSMFLLLRLTLRRWASEQQP